MTVELVKDGNPADAAFKWPEEPEDLSPWGGKRMDQIDFSKMTKEKRMRVYKEEMGEAEDEKMPQDEDDFRRKAGRLRRQREEAEMAKERDVVEKEHTEVDEVKVPRDLARERGLRKPKLLEIG